MAAGENECQHAARAFNAEASIVHLACDSWSCDYCRKILAWRWAQRIAYGIALRPDKEPWFWTLTLPPWVLDAKTGYKVLPGRWDRLRRELQRGYADFCYAAFVEAHPNRSNIPHFHIITFTPSPRRFKDMAVHAGFGHQAKELEINGKMAVNYVSKYASKGSASIPRNFRRVRISAAWPRLPDPEYPIKVYPLDRGEALTEYLRRMSITLGRPVALLRSDWLDHSRDIL
jgi:hypothetical protein